LVGFETQKSHLDQTLLDRRENPCQKGLANFLQSAHDCSQSSATPWRAEFINLDFRSEPHGSSFPY
jgi:hypothetical protein